MNKRNEKQWIKFLIRCEESNGHRFIFATTFKFIILNRKPFTDMYYVITNNFDLSNYRGHEINSIEIDGV